ncbi:hypothetical protein BGY98DRAFT_965702 [Russula aff. rugulosa BPL654]|nr:hypothetical protein BGY98DRAFT_965702 [Russula aff. rugulosa BPL654]
MTAKKLLFSNRPREAPLGFTIISRLMHPGSALNDMSFSVFTISHWLIPSHDSRHAFLSTLLCSTAKDSCYCRETLHCSGFRVTPT